MTSLADFLMRNRLDALGEKPEYTTADVNSLMPAPSWKSPLAGLGSYQLSQEAGAEPNWFGRNVLSNIPPEAMHAANFLIPGKVPRIPNPIKAYHGSPHDFDKFDLSKIGTGEGAQAYGHGLYFAEKEGVARWYRNELAKQQRDARRNLADDKSEAAREIPRALWNTVFPDPTMNRAEARQYLKDVTADYRRARDELKTRAPVENGRMYEVALHATPEQFLDWDKPLTAQSPQVKAALTDLGIGPDLYENRSLMRRILNRAPAGEDALVALSRQTDTDITSQALGRRDVLGTRYLDQGSRGAGSGTSNFVVWSPEIIEILRKYGLAPAIAAPSLASVLQDQESQ